MQRDAYLKKVMECLVWISAAPHESFGCRVAEAVQLVPTVLVRTVLADGKSNDWVEMFQSCALVINEGEVESVVSSLLSMDREKIRKIVQRQRVGVSEWSEESFKEHCKRLFERMVKLYTPNAATLKEISKVGLDGLTWDIFGKMNLAPRVQAEDLWKKM